MKQTIKEFFDKAIPTNDDLAVKIIRDGKEIAEVKTDSGHTISQSVSCFELPIKAVGELNCLVVNHKTGEQETLKLGKNVIETRMGLVMSRLAASLYKQFVAGFSPNPLWAGYTGLNYTGVVSPGSVSYPFNSTDIGGTYASILEKAFVFGGVPTNIDTLTGKTSANQNGTYANFLDNTKYPFYTDAGAVYSLGISGMAFGNGGHAINFSTITADTNDSSGFVIDPTSITIEDYSKPAQPYSGGNFGYTWPGGGVLANYPNLHQPDSFVYEAVMNGVVPYGYAGLNNITDNTYSFGTTQCVYEGNTTLYSETMRLPLDKDGLFFRDGYSCSFKVTVPADNELNQTRAFSYLRRARNVITEAGLITGENILVQSPDYRTPTALDVTAGGISNKYGAMLVSTYTGVDASNVYNAYYESLPKDYFTRLRNPRVLPSWFMDSDFLNIDSQNNTWNLVARKIFGAITKTNDVSLVFIWTITWA